MGEKLFLLLVHSIPGCRARQEVVTELVVIVGKQVSGNWPQTSYKDAQHHPGMLEAKISHVSCLVATVCARSRVHDKDGEPVALQMVYKSHPP